MYYCTICNYYCTTAKYKAEIASSTPTQYSALVLKVINKTYLKCSSTVHSIVGGQFDGLNIQPATTLYTIMCAVYHHRGVHNYNQLITERLVDEFLLEAALKIKS